MKKFLFIAAAIVLAFGTAAANGPDAEELKLEQEFAREEKSMAEMLKNERSAAAWKESRKAAYKLRYEDYRKAAQKNPGGVIQAINPPDCAYYSTEGVCILPRTMITPYPKIAHVNTVLDFRFPRRLAGFEARGIMVYPTKEMGYSIKYIDPETKTVADIYIYDLPADAGDEKAALVRELRNVAGGISASYRNARIDERFREGKFRHGEKIAFIFFFAGFDSPGFNDKHELAKCQSFTLLTAKNGKILKMRITRSGDDRDALTNVVNGFLGAFDQKVILDSQTRTRKFERADIPPVLPMRP
ncbi:MAG: hypothetical protein J6Y54_05835 [Lentisphaeria bacterium]|nr:hypothetical protein [Lentisphaeria bacterium]